MSLYVFFFNDTATTEIYTLSLHDALPISSTPFAHRAARRTSERPGRLRYGLRFRPERSEEHTSELQSPCNLVCRLLLEKKKASAPSTRSWDSSSATAPPAGRRARCSTTII